MPENLESFVYLIPTVCRGFGGITSVYSVLQWTVKIGDLRLHEIRDIISPNTYSEEEASPTTKKKLLNKVMLVPRNCCLRMNK